MESWVEDYYSAADAMDLEEVLSKHTEDAVFSYNNAPVVRGKAEMRESITGFWDTIGGLEHEITASYQDGDTVIVESDVHYTRKDGGKVTIKTVSILHRKGTLVDRITFYNDPSPLYS